ncbi:hypothetical protein [Actinoplanes sp. NPDC051851]|uniref:hypothetical protein n=1 Tax=Actinoplanes sp. NPDC051851 TaxID=3154753 RepID=UPI003446531A
MGSADATVAGLCFGCGGGLPGGHAVCPWCGAPVVLDRPPAPPAAVPPPTSGPSLTFGSAASEVRPPRSRRPGLITVAVLAVLVLVAGAVGGVRLLTERSPESAVADYFGALGDGDAVAALQLVDGGGSVDPAGFPLLTDAALRDRGHRPSDASVGEATEVGTLDARPAWQVGVTFRAGGQEIRQTLVVSRTDEGDYLLNSPFVTVAVSDLRGRAITVNGADLGSLEHSMVAFPGSYEAVAVGNALLGEARASAVPQASGQGWLAVFNFGTPQLAPGAEDQIRTQVRTRLDQCATSTQAQTTGCPFGLTVWGTGVTVKWTISAYPGVRVLPGANGWYTGNGVQITDDGAGKVDWSAEYTDFTGAVKKESGDASFRFVGSASVSGSGIEISLV